MAKRKQHRSTSSARKRSSQRPVRTAAAVSETAAQTPRGAGQRSAPQATAPAPSAPARPSAMVDFANEYRYVLGDLRRIGILAAGMFATLVALALIIR